MIKIIAGMNEVKGTLKSYERDGDDLVLRLALRGPHTMDIRLPKIQLDLVNFITKLGLETLKNSTIDLNAGVIRPDDVLKSDGKTVRNAKQRFGARQTRVGTGSIVG